MPTKKKRVGFIPREDVMKIIDKLSIENNLSNSKIINILVEEALSSRGMFDKTTGKVTQSYIEILNSSQHLSKHSKNSKDNDKFRIYDNYINHTNSDRTNIVEKENNETFDLQTYKKFISFLKFQEMINEFNT